MLPLQEFRQDLYVFLTTTNGTVKKTALDQFDKINVRGIKAINLDDDDSLVGAAITSAEHDVLLTSRNGFAVRFRDDRVRPMGRTAGGVRGITLRTGDRVVGMVTFERESPVTLITVCERGYGKRTSLTEYPVKNRGGKGESPSAPAPARRAGPHRRRGRPPDPDQRQGKIIRIRVKDISTGVAPPVRVHHGADDGERSHRAPRRSPHERHRRGLAHRGCRRRHTVPMEAGELEVRRGGEGEAETRRRRRYRHEGGGDSGANDVGPRPAPCRPRV
jgi:hypothetical protein